MIARNKQPQLIESRPGVCGGAACIAGRRIPVWMLYEERLAGMTDEEILKEHKMLTRQEVAAAWKYVKQNEEEVLSEIRRNRDL
jgi:uncharacterized protein (DUF433 family)